MYFMCHKIKETITTSHTPNSIADDNNNSNTNTELNEKIRVCEEFPIVYGT